MLNKKIRVDLIAKLAAESFKNHQIVKRLDVDLFRHWRCGQPNTNIYAFNITTIPGRIVVTGDIGVLVVEREPDMLPWCQGAIDSIDYFAQKVPHEITTKEYDSEIAKKWVKEQIASDELNERQQEALESIYDFENQHEVIYAIYDGDVLSDSDWPDFNNWKSSFLWCREAIKWFLNHEQCI